MLQASHRAARRRLGPLAVLVLPIVFVFALMLAPSALAGGGKLPTVVSGHGHACAQDDVGHVHCWGLNNRGQLGVGDTADRSAPAQVPGVQGAYALAAYGHGTCAVVDGKVWCWGANDLGQLGQGGQDADPHPTPVQVPGVEGIWRISGGDAHVCAVDWSGSVYCWGSNSDGQLANGTVGGVGATPAKVGDTKDVYSLASGAKFTCVGLHSKKTRCAGVNGLGQLGNAALGANSATLAEVPGLTKAYEIHAGTAHVCGLTWGDAHVMCWGDNALGQVGQGTLGETTPRGPTGVTLSPWATTATSGGGSPWAMAIGGTTGATCALYDNRKLACWGDGTDGVLGVGSQDSSGTPLAVGLDNVAAVSSSSTSHTQCAIVRGGQPYCWGGNNSGEAGVGAPSGAVLTPSPVAGLDLITRPQYPASSWIEPLSKLRINTDGTAWRLRSRLTVEPSWFVFPDQACRGKVVATVYYWRKIGRRSGTARNDEVKKRKVGVRDRGKLKLVGDHCKAYFEHQIPLARFAGKKRQLRLSAAGWGNAVQSRFETGEYELKDYRSKKK